MACLGQLIEMHGKLWEVGTKAILWPVSFVLLDWHKECIDFCLMCVHLCCKNTAMFSPVYAFVTRRPFHGSFHCNDLGLGIKQNIHVLFSTSAFPYCNYPVLLTFHV